MRAVAVYLFYHIAPPSEAEGGVPLTTEEEAARNALQAEYDRLLEENDSAEDLPEAVDRRLDEIEAALATFDHRPPVFDPTDIGRAGTFVSIAQDGTLRVERGYVRPEDELPIAGTEEAEPTPVMAADIEGVDGIIAAAVGPIPEPDDDDDGLARFPTGCWRN